jgi:small subunit ribosomal protein S6
MKKAYELTFIVRLEANEEAINEAIERVKNWVEADDMGTVKKIDHWGRRRLAFELNGQREGYYVLMEVDIDASHIEELDRNLKLSGSILRYLLIRAEPTEQKAKQSDQAEEQQENP